MPTRAERNFLKLPFADHREGDDKAMTQAINFFSLHCSDARRPENNTFQLKLSSAVSYYPRNGRIHVDGGAKGREERGLQAVLALLKERDELD